MGQKHRRPQAFAPQVTRLEAPLQGAFEAKLLRVDGAFSSFAAT
jgi:hypothetical protein